MTPEGAEAVNRLSDELKDLNAILVAQAEDNERRDAERAQLAHQRIRRGMFAAVAAVLVVVLVGAAMAVGLRSLARTNREIAEQGRAQEMQGAQLEALFRADSEDRAARVGRLNAALGEVAEQFTSLDEAAAVRQEELRSQIFTRLDQLERAIYDTDCAPGQPAPRATNRPLPPLTRRDAPDQPPTMDQPTPATPAPAPPPPQTQESPGVIIPPPPEDTCLLGVLCVG